MNPCLISPGESEIYEIVERLDDFPIHLVEISLSNGQKWRMDTYYTHHLFSYRSMSVKTIRECEMGSGSFNNS